MQTRIGFEECARPSNLLWFDGEYTGLDPSNDIILEVGFLATDFDLNILDGYTSFVKQEESNIRDLSSRNIHWSTRESEIEEFIEGCATGTPISEIDLAISGIAKRFTFGNPGILAGNSLFTDRRFILAYLPNFSQLLHYRMLDVSSFKIYAQATQGIEFKKALNHRAFEDIHESIAEYKALTQLLDWH